jgi:hypothetical protein
MAFPGRSPPGWRGTDGDEVAVPVVKDTPTAVPGVAFVRATDWTCAFPPGTSGPATGDWYARVRAPNLRPSHGVTGMPACRPRTSAPATG